ncbi:MAG: methyltransferase domain-containing protein [Pseudomonadota bacterium]
MRAEQILATYDAVADTFAKERNKSLFERPWLDRFLAHVRPPRRVLDIGCGTGQPIARYLVDRRADVTGVDGAAAMIAHFAKNVPTARAVHADMRQMALGARFDGLLAWNSFFHLSQSDQRAMFGVFQAHAAPGAVLMFTSGHHAGEVTGQAGGQPVYHASLDPDEYRSLLAAHGFSVLRYAPEDPETHSHTIWLARFTQSASS